MNSFTKPHTILFDWDGTLAETIAPVVAAHNHVRDVFGLPPWTATEFQAGLQHSAQERFEFEYGERAKEALKLFYEHIEKNYMSGVSLKPGAEDLLNTCLEMDIAVGVVSNLRHSYLVEQIESFGWTERMQAVVGAGLAAKDKPAADPILLALKKMYVEPSLSHVWYVGDTETDLLAAKNAVCSAIFLEDGVARPQLIQKYNPLATFNGCIELKNALLNGKYYS